MNDKKNDPIESIDVTPDAENAKVSDISMDAASKTDAPLASFSNDDIIVPDDDAEDSRGFFQKAPFLVGLSVGLLALLLIIFVSSPSKNTQNDADKPVIVEVAHNETNTKELPTDEATESHETKHEDIAEEPSTPMVEDAPPPATIPIVAETAILITDVGLKTKIAKAIAEKLPTETSVAVSTYASDVSRTIAAFKATGRDVWFQIASQSLKPNIDPGTLALSSNLTLNENKKLLERQLATTSEKFIGLYIPDDADITQGAESWRQLAGDVLRDLMILDGTKAKVATGLYVKKAADQVSAYLKADVIIAGDEGPKALREALAAAIPVILKQQEAIIVIQEPTTLAIDMVASWIKTFPSKGLSLVPASKFTGLKP